MKTYCSACGHQATVNRKGYCSSCGPRIAANEKANRQIDRNVTTGRAKPYDVPNSPYKACARCNTRGPLAYRGGQDVCAQGCPR